MARPKLSMAFSLYDRHVPFFDGTAQVANVDLEVLAVGEANSLRDGGKRHHRMLVDLEFDACEVSLSSYIIAKSKGVPLVAIPVFPRRLFSQSNIWTYQDSAVCEPRDLAGRKVGLITFQTTLSVQARGDLQREYGVPWRGVDWYVAAEEPIAVSTPRDIAVKRIPQGKKLNEMLEDRSLDAIVTPRPPVPTPGTNTKFRRVFPNARAEETRYFRKHGFFPVMHVMVLKEETVRRYPWAPGEFVRAFRQAHEICHSYYLDPNWTVHGWTQHLKEEEQSSLGADLWPIGLVNNLCNIELFIDYMREQELISERISPADLFSGD